ncbi:MAG TPA: Gfo/Idh/MocA family oxidoreductase [Candidatus Aminicenantes bacterium]|nr:Gfo/Idh/MocA family oxidoreductase [Candidatus Aminicenantes bacterium]
MEQIDFGVIGYGIRSKVLLGACSAFKDMRFTAVAETDPAARESAGSDRPGIAVFEDFREMLDSGLVSAVLVETPPSTHAACSIAALERGIHVLSDVPAVHETGEAGPLWAAAKKSRAVYSFGATTNFWAHVDACLDLKRKGLIGEPYYCEADYVADLGGLARMTPWRRHFEPIRYCTHSLGPILKWIEEDLTEVSCFGTGSHIHGDPEEHDAMVAVFKTKTNKVVKLLISFASSHPAPFHRYVCHGTKGFFEKTQPLAGGESQALFSSSAVYGLHGLNRLAVAEGRPELAGAAGVGEHGGADYLMIKDFLESVSLGKQPEVGIQKALAMTLPGLYALASAKAGGALTAIKYPWG